MAPIFGERTRKGLRRPCCGRNNDDGAGFRVVPRVLEDEEDICEVISKLLAAQSSKHALSDPITATVAQLPAVGPESDRKDGYAI